MPPPPERNTVNEMSEWEFQRCFGTVEPMGLPDVRALFEGAPFTWWVAGGSSLELAAGRTEPLRHHLDRDIAFPCTDVPAVRAWLAAWHIWEAHEGIRPLLPAEEPRADREQWWLRRDAWSPWVLDLLLTPVEGTDWLFKKDHRVRRPLASVVRHDADGTPYQAPEVTLLFKALLDRPKDLVDLAATWPLLDAEARGWLRSSVDLALPASTWVARLAALSG